MRGPQVAAASPWAQRALPAAAVLLPLLVLLLVLLGLLHAQVQLRVPLLLMVQSRWRAHRVRQQHLQPRVRASAPAQTSQLAPLGRAEAPRS
jgi:hypothetical protein